jgi:MarR family transcriptional regulator for hemolysin
MESPDLLLLVYDVARLLRIDGDKRARAHGMSRAQWIILLWLRRQPGLSQKELSEIVEVEPITVARLVDRLQARGMVERRADPKDRRIWRLHLLPAAAEVLQTIESYRSGLKRSICDGVSPEAERVVTEALVHMKANLIAERRCVGIQGLAAPHPIEPNLEEPNLEEPNLEEVA